VDGLKAFVAYDVINYPIGALIGSGRSGWCRSRTDLHPFGVGEVNGHFICNVEDRRLGSPFDAVLGADCPREKCSTLGETNYLHLAFAHLKSISLKELSRIVCLHP